MKYKTWTDFPFGLQYVQRKKIFGTSYNKLVK